MTQEKSHICQFCGREFELKEVAQLCPADDCPSHWEEKGIPHPGYELTLKGYEALHHS